VGGAEAMLLNLLVHGDRDRCRHKVIALSASAPLAEEIRGTGAEVVSLGMGPRLSAVAALPRLRREIRAFAPDVVQTWMYHADLVGGIVSRLAVRAPLAWGVHHSNLDPRFNKRSTIAIARICALLSHRLPAKIVCCSRATRRTHARIGYDEDKLVVITNGFDGDVFRPDADARREVRAELGFADSDLVVGMIGRHHPLKDHGNFFAAAALAREKHPDLRFVLCGLDVDRPGGGPETLARERGVLDATRLLGRREDIARLVNAFDVGTISSLSESFPMVVCETMLGGVPCVVTDAGDAADIVGVTGLVVPVSDPGALAGGWLRFADMAPRERRAAGAAARRRILDNFGIAAVGDRYHDLWAGLC
jgi:glycosyltransferase involved in cell wall biosynthesis